MRKRPVWLFLLILIMLGADQFTKFLVRRSIMPGESHQLLPFLELDHIENKGMAFGMLGDYGGIIVFVTTMVVLVLIVAAMTVRHDGHMFLPLALLVAGSSGNLLDRFARGSVTDFIHFPYWPAFNLADIYIVTGVLLLARMLILKSGNEEEAAGANG